MPKGEVHAALWRHGATWHGRVDAPGARIRNGRSRSAVIARLRADARASTLVIETVPALVGVAEAAAILGWDKRRVFTYISRDSFPEPVARLASGRVWRKQDIEEFARERRRRGR